jgi:putative hydrolase of the HAD superfamily
VNVSEERAKDAIALAWREHQVRWHRGEAFTAEHMVRHALRLLEVDLAEEATSELTTVLESEALNHGVRALPGAREALDALAQAGIRRALVCDTGFSPGRIVRELLSRAGVADLLEAFVFSDEVGAPKPHSKPFETALAALGARPHEAAHVGDLRRSDVAGARAMGMRTIRLTLAHDDSDASVGANAGVIDCATAGCAPVCSRPEADTVAPSYADVMAALGVR